jgi:hypothetical protein
MDPALERQNGHKLHRLSKFGLELLEEGMRMGRSRRTRSWITVVRASQNISSASQHPTWNVSRNYVVRLPKYCVEAESNESG